MRSSASRRARALATLTGVALAAAAAWLASGGHRALRPLLEGPEAGARRALAALAAGAPLDVAAGAVTLRVDRLRFRDPLATPRGDEVDVVAVADADGAVGREEGRVAVSYLGRERLRLARCAAGWCVEGGALPRLAALLSTLAQRADALDRGDVERYGPLVDDGYRGAVGGKGALLRRLRADLAASPRARFRPLAWQVRIERETAQVGEDYEIALGAGPPRRLRARFSLRDAGGRWLFTDGP